ncbi:unnamed protein product [Adineta steineri]|uniref:Fucosyltransferase n=1 Tax=Adineta steineri TaxID=433720 RepID=A0A818Q8W1_9BILA|nr:unnamed protein product [Adineta steineri]CAF3634443.1 unnamed protein product [Adineta steineri]
MYTKYRNRHFRFISIFLVIFTICFLYTTYDPKKNDDQHSETSPTQLFDTNTSIYVPLSEVKQQSYRTVLLWTDLFSDIHWHQEAFFNPYAIVACSSTHQCQFTRDTRRLSKSSIVAFHLYDINRYRLPERTTQSKTDNQSWVFITGESPINFYYQNPSFLPHMLDSYFDQSISYKYDSPFSIFSPTIKSRTLSNTYEIQQERQSNNNSLKSKNKPILWFVSNCNTFSQREKYVEELKKYIEIDIYGKCGRKCSKEKNSQCQANLNEYYFYLSFENSRCHSYITEKFWNIISDNKNRLVPIVMGASINDYKQIAPKQSFIHVDQYKTPEELAKYLNYLIANPKKYLTYLQWREYNQIEPINSTRWKTLLCPLCQMAYETHLSPSIRMNFSAWYHPTTQCHHDDAELFTKCKQANLRDPMNWIHNTKCP